MFLATFYCFRKRCHKAPYEPPNSPLLRDDVMRAGADGNPHFNPLKNLQSPKYPSYPQILVGFPQAANKMYPKFVRPLSCMLERMLATC